MNKTNNIKKMSAKSRYTLQYVIMTVALSIILIVCAIGIMFLTNGTQVEAIEKQENNTEKIVEYIEPTKKSKKEYIEVKPAIMTLTEERKEPQYINLGEYRLTAYCSCEKCCEEYGKNRPKDKDGNDIVYTASGKVAQAGYTVAADPSVLPYGTIIYINGHRYEVQDCGGAIKGNRIDIYFDNHDAATEFGIQYADVFVENH